MNKPRQNLIVGTVVLVALFILIFGMFFLKEYRPGQKLDGYVLLVDQVGLLSKDDPVKFNGVRKGKVSDIKLTRDNTLVEVYIAVEAGARIPEGSEIRIQNVGLMGERMINIAIAKDATKTYPPGSRIPARYDYGIAETMGVAGDVLLEVKAMVEDLRLVYDSTVGRPEFPKTINTLLARADAISARLDSLIVEIEPQVQSSVGNLAAASATARGMADRTAPKVDTLLASAQRSTAEVEALLADLRKVSGDVKTIVEKARSGESSLGKLANDDRFYRDLSSTVTSADTLLKTIKKRGLDINVDLW